MNAESVYPLEHPSVIASLEAMSYGRKSWEAKRDECYAWKRVRDGVDLDAGSNVGRRNISYRARGSKSLYVIEFKGAWDPRLGRASVHAPATLEEAQYSDLLGKAVAKRDAMRSQLIAQYGEQQSRTFGFGAEISKVLRSTSEGRDWIKETPSFYVRVITYAATAAAYEAGDWQRKNPRCVHMLFRTQPDRLDLLRQRVWTESSAKEEVKRRTAAKGARRDPYTATPASTRTSRGHGDASPFVPKLVGKPAEWSPAAIQVLKAEWIDRSKALDALGLYDDMVDQFDDLQQFEDDESATA